MRLKDKLRIGSARVLFGAMALWERLRYGVGVNLLSPAYLDDPYPALNHLRDVAPIHYSPAIKGYWVTEFSKVQEVLRDARFGADVRRYERHMKPFRKRATAQQLERLENPSMLTLDPPDHSRLRRLVTHGFLFKYIQSLEPRIQQIMDRCLARVDNAATFDVVDAVARPLPAIVIAEMMGLPESDHDQFQTWSEELIAGTGISSVETSEAADRANDALIDYFKRIIEQRRGAPLTDDLIGQLMRAEEQGDKLNAKELYNTCLLLLVAGHETTTRLIGNGLFNLLIRPEQFEYLREHPDAIPAAIEEMLRFEPPVMATVRFAREPMDFHGTPLEEGDQVFVSLAAANRDPAVNAHPEEFDVQRETAKQISFGHGIHLCLGAALARLEAKVAFRTLLDRYPQMRLADREPHWDHNPFFRGLKALNVVTGSTAASAPHIGGGRS
ncbi:MAG: cytochrome P450 [Pseudomonadales bacterium]